MESFRTIEWLRNLIRKDSKITEAGRGIFAQTVIEAHVCVALYWGHVVSQAGVVQIECPSTRQLFENSSDVQRPWSMAHAVSLDNKPWNLLVDGSHHTGSTYDHVAGRNNLPWGSCLNSSDQTGIPPNCYCVFFDSPLLDHYRESSKQLGNCNNKQGFIFTKRRIEVNEELR